MRLAKWLSAEKFGLAWRDQIPAGAITFSFIQIPLEKYESVIFPIAKVTGQTVQDDTLGVIGKQSEKKTILNSKPIGCGAIKSTP